MIIRAPGAVSARVAEPVTLAERIKAIGPVGLDSFSVSGRDVLVYQTEEGLSRLEWIDRDAVKNTVMVNYYRSAIHAAAGSTDEALESLEYTLEQGFRDFVTLEASPYFVSLREDPRFRDLVDRYK